MNSTENDRRRIAYVGPVPFPEGGAAARRILGNAFSLKDAGYDVLIGSGQMPRENRDNPFEYQGLEVHSLGERTAEHLPALIKHLFYFKMGRKTVRWLERLVPKPTAVVLYSGYSPYFMRLLPWCRSAGIPLIFDAVEWYEAANIPGGRFSPNRWNFELAMRHYCVKTGNIIAISKFLERYYFERGCRTVRVPPTLDTENISPVFAQESHQPLTIGYTGIPSRKDLFDNWLEAILEVDPNRKAIFLRVAGISRQEILRYPAMRKRGISELPRGIEALGLIPHSDALALIGQVDFSVLLRKPLRYAQAGFPTKVVESLAIGTPVVCNITSDLGDYIRDGVEGVVCRDHQPESVIEALRRIQSFPPEKRQHMREAARQQAERSFDYRRYIDPLGGFIRSASSQQDKIAQG